MLIRVYLASTSVYVSFAHNKIIVNEYLIEVDEVFAIIKNAIESNSENELLNSRIRSDSFNRITP